MLRRATPARNINYHRLGTNPYPLRGLALLLGFEPVSDIADAIPRHVADDCVERAFAGLRQRFRLPTPKHRPMVAEFGARQIFIVGKYVRPFAHLSVFPLSRLPESVRLSRPARVRSTGSIYRLGRSIGRGLWWSGSANSLRTGFRSERMRRKPDNVGRALSRSRHAAGMWSETGRRCESTWRSRSCPRLRFRLG